MQKDFHSRRQSTAAAKSTVSGLHKEVAVLTAKVSDLESANATLRKELETLFSTHVKEEISLANDLCDVLEDLGKIRENAMHL